jgi:DNA helicase-2/ATP-dependent DNA helicase PcrA
VKFYERKEIKDVLSYLRSVFNPSDLVAFSRIVNVPSRKLGEKSVEGFRNFMESHHLDLTQALADVETADGIGPAAKTAFAAFSNLHSELRQLSERAGVKDLMDAIIKRTKYEDYLRGEYSKEEVEGKLENLKEFLNMASRYDGLEPRESLTLFLEDVALITDQDRSTETSGVSLMTIHLSKGLEFSNVVIAGAEEGLFPHSRSLMEAKAMEEERRLMYVAMTRAKKRLFITRARERYTFGNYSANPGSRFLKEIPEHLVVKVDPTPKYSFGNLGSSATTGYSWLKGSSDSGSGFSNATRATQASQATSDDMDQSAPKTPGYDEFSQVRHHVRHDPSDFHLGCRIRHAQFGEGVVVSLKDEIAEIAFSGGTVRGIKKMNVRIAPIEKI